MNLARDNHPEIREAVRSLCEQFDSAYWQRIDAARAYPPCYHQPLIRILSREWILSRRSGSTPIRYLRTLATTFKTLKRFGQRT